MKKLGKKLGSAEPVEPAFCKSDMCVKTGIMLLKNYLKEESLSVIICINVKEQKGTSSLFIDSQSYIKHYVIDMYFLPPAS